jgi:hypothetical protein
MVTRAYRANVSRWTPIQTFLQTIISRTPKPHFVGPTQLLAYNHMSAQAGGGVGQLLIPEHGSLLAGEVDGMGLVRGV